MLSSRIPMALEEAYKQRDEIVPLFLGEPGIGKTQAIKKFADEKGVKMVTFILSTALPSEVSGIRMPDNDTKLLEVFDDSRMASLADGDILFFDEIFEAPALWSACLTLIQDRMMASGRKLPDVMIVAASNPLSHPDVVPPSMRDRFMTFQVRWDEKAWVEHTKKALGIKGNTVAWNDLVTQISNGLDAQSRYGYNVLTPRRASKMLKWYMDSGQSDDVLDLVTDMFDVVLRDLVKSVFVVSDADIAISMAAQYMSKEFGIEFDVSCYADVEPQDIFDAINRLEGDEKILAEAYLKGVEF